MNVRCVKCQMMPPTGISEAYDLKDYITLSAEDQIPLYCVNPDCEQEFTYGEARLKDYRAQIIYVNSNFDIFEANLSEIGIEVPKSTKPQPAADEFEDVIATIDKI